MTYIEGFVAAVPTARKDEYKKHARDGSVILKDCGVPRTVENWADDVPRGKATDFYRSVQAKDDESIVFSWFEYPDKASRDAANAKMMSDPRMEEMGKTMPFDGQRMIMGGFETIVDRGGQGEVGYTDGYVVPVPKDKKQAYLDIAEKMAAKFEELGAVRIVEAWSDDVPEGKVTDFKRAVKAEDGEAIVYSYVQWPDKATRDAGWDNMMNDPEMQPQGETPFDGKRMFWGGFRPILDTSAE